MDGTKSLLAVGALLGTVICNADDYECDYPQFDPCCQIECCDYEKCFTPCIDVTPSARTCPNSCGFFIDGAFIYWLNQLEDQEVIGSIEALPDGRGQISFKELDFSWKPGFKVGIGYNFGFDAWDLFANWTEIRSTEHKSFSNTTPFIAVVAAVFQPGALYLLSRDAHVHWHYRFDSVDLELGRHFFVGRNLSLRPFIGAKWADIHQKLNADFFSNIEQRVNNVQVAVGDASARLSQRTMAVGPRAGLNTRWALSCYDFAILGNVALSLPWNWAKVKSDGTVQFSPGSIVISGNLVENHKHFMEPVFEFFLGLDWRHCFCDWFSMEIAAGYEMQLWWRQNRWFDFGPIQDQNNISMQGLTLTVGFGF